MGTVSQRVEELPASNVRAVCLEETVDYLRDRLGPRLKDISLGELVVGVFFTGVRLNTGHMGVAFTPIGEMPEAVCCPTTAARMPQAGKMRGKQITEVLSYAMDRNVLKSAIGVAAVNALSQCLWEAEGCEGYEIIPGKDAVEEVDFSQARGPVVVGAFTPYIRQLKALGKDFVILEKSQATLKNDELRYYRPADAAEEVLSASDVVIITGTCIVNHTVDELLSYIPERGYVVISGPTASMVPLAFFKRGVNLMGGIRIEDADRALRILSEAGSGYHLLEDVAEKVIMKPK